MQSLKISTESGSLLLELCIALAIFSSTMSFIVYTITLLHEETQNAEVSQAALQISKSNLEFALATSSDSLPLGTTTVSLTSSTSTQLLPFTIQSYLITTFITPCRYTIESRIEWKSFNQNKNISLSTLRTDPSYAITLGKDCNENPTQNSSGKIQQSEFQFGNSAKISDIDILDSFAYVALATSSTQDAGIYTLDITDPQHISELSYLAEENIKAIDVAGTNIFEAIDGTSSQFHIISILDPEHPKMLAKISLPDVVPAGSFPGGVSIFYYDSKVYIGTHRTAGPEFHIFDVKNPEIPVWLGSIELNHNINSIEVRGNYAYLGTSGNIKNIIILDISNPHSIKEVSSIAFLGNEDTTKISLISHYLIVGRIKSAKNNGTFEIIDISDPIHPNLLSTLQIPATILDMTFYNNNEYILTAQPSLIKININDSHNPHVESTQNLSESPNSLDYENNMLMLGLTHKILCEDFPL